MTTLEKFEMPHIATIEFEGRRYNVALRIEHDGVEFVGRLWFADDAWAEDDGIVDQGVLPGRTAELVISHAQSLGERELVQRYRRALASPGFWARLVLLDLVALAGMVLGSVRWRRIVL